MSAGSVSLESALRTCKVDTAWADKIASDRFLNPDNMVCPIWNGMDTSGRPVCPDSFVTKRAGCNSALDRVAVENSVSRPQYFEYLTLDAAGVNGAIYGNMPHSESVERQKSLSGINEITGNFGTQFGANVYPKCSSYPYREAMSQVKQYDRQMHSMQMGYEGYMKQQNSGF